MKFIICSILSLNGTLNLVMSGLQEVRVYSVFFILQKIAESLCSILLLENSNPRQVFNEFLLARTSAVQQLFHGSNQSVSTKDQIGTIVQLVTTTIHQIHAVFYKEEEGSQTDAVDQSGQSAGYHHKFW